MINVNLLLKEKQLIRIEIEGHAGYGKVGEDIYCSAVSALSYSVIIGLKEVLNFDFEYRIDSRGYMIFSICEELRASDKAMAIVNTFIRTIEYIQVEYSKYVSVNYEEV